MHATDTRPGLNPPWGRALWGLVLFATVALTNMAVAAPTFPPLTGRVVDQAQILSAESEAQLTGKLAALEARTGRQVVVATLSDLQGYEIEDYGYQLGRAWKVGDAKRDDGVVFLIAPKDRKVRIEVGYGLEPVLTDTLSSLILQRAVVPRFRSGDIEGGVIAGTDEILQQLALPDDEARTIAQAAKAPARQQSSDAQGIIIFVIFVVIWMLMSRGRRRNRGLAAALPWIVLDGLTRHSGGGGWGGGSGGGGGFSGGGGSFGGGGSSGSW